MIRLLVLLLLVATAAPAWAASDSIKVKEPDAAGGQVREVDNESFARGSKTIYRQRVRICGLNDTDCLIPEDLSGVKALPVSVQNKSEVAGQSGSSTVDSYARCTQTFNILLDASEIIEIHNANPGAGKLMYICEFNVHSNETTGTSNVTLYADDESNCANASGSARVTIWGPWNVQAGAAGLPLIQRGGAVGPIVWGSAGMRLCFGGDSTLDLRVTGTFRVDN